MPARDTRADCAAPVRRAVVVVCVCGVVAARETDAVREIVAVALRAPFADVFVSVRFMFAVRETVDTALRDTAVRDGVDTTDDLDTVARGKTFVALLVVVD